MQKIAEQRDMTGARLSPKNERVRAQVAKVE